MAEWGPDLYLSDLTSPRSEQSFPHSSTCPLLAEPLPSSSGRTTEPRVVWIFTERERKRDRNTKRAMKCNKCQSVQFAASWGPFDRAGGCQECLRRHDLNNIRPLWLLPQCVSFHFDPGSSEIVRDHLSLQCPSVFSFKPSTPLRWSQTKCFLKLFS